MSAAKVCNIMFINAIFLLYFRIIIKAILIKKRPRHRDLSSRLSERQLKLNVQF